MDYQVAVVGGGVMGYCTALQLARQGYRTVLIEQFPSPHSRGSSTGQSRITRLANFGPRALTSIMKAAMDEWKKIQNEAGMKLLCPHPLLVLGLGVEGGQMAQMEQSVRDSGLQPQWTTVQDVNNTYGTNFPSNLMAFYDPGAGILLADQCILALKKLYLQAGGTLLEQWQVDSIQPVTAKEINIVGPKGTVTCKKVAVCAGPWTSPLLEKLGIHLPLSVIKVGVYYWRLKDKSLPTTTFVDVSLHRSQHFYGFPTIEYPGLIKMGVHNGTPTDPNTRDSVDNSAVRHQALQYAGTRFPCLDPIPAVEESCMYTVTPDEDMILDHHPDFPNIVYACGFSGTGFKSGPVIGQLLSQMVNGQPTAFDISDFRATRFPQTHFTKQRTAAKL